MELTKFSLLKRRSDISHAQFLSHWHTVHVDVLVSKGRHKHYNRSYIQNDFQGLDPADEWLFDGAAQMVPRSSQFVNNGFQQDPLYAQFVRPDELLFLSPEKCVVLYCESQEIGNTLVSRGHRKLLCLVSRAAPANKEEWREGWQARARSLLTELQGPQGIRQHWVLPGSATNMGNGVDQVKTIDMVEELFFDREDQLVLFLRNERFLKSFQSHGVLPLGAGSHAFMAHEHLVYEGQ